MGMLCASSSVLLQILSLLGEAIMLCAGFNRISPAEREVRDNGQRTLTVANPAV
jgi:hypothetical protein